MNTTNYCRCGGEKMIKVGAYEFKYNPFVGKDVENCYFTHLQPAYYTLAPNERIQEVFCSTCGLIYSLDSIGRN